MPSKKSGNGSWSEATAEILKEIRDAIRELRGDVKELRGDVKELRGDVHELREESKKTNDRLDLTNGRLDSLATEMRTGFDTLGHRIDNLLLGPHGKEHGELRDRVGRLEGEVAAIKSKLEQSP